MRLGLFRKKLEYEIQEVETIIKTSECLNQVMQTHIYCIAALLRKIMTRLPSFRNVKIPIGNHYMSDETTDTIILWTLVNHILHYTIFIPYANQKASLPIEHIHLLSRKDDHSTLRKIRVADFIQIAKQIATEDDAILPNLLKHTLNCLGTVIHSPHVDRHHTTEAEESLMDCFDIINKMESKNWPDGKIPLFIHHYNVLAFKEARRMEIHEIESVLKEPPHIEIHEVEYDTLFQNIFVKWSLVSFDQLGIYKGLHDKLKSHRVFSLKDYSGAFNLFIIRLTDLRDVLCAVQSNLRVNSKAV